MEATQDQAVSDAAAFESGFNTTRGTTPVEKPAPKAEVKAEAPKAPKAEAQKAETQKAKAEPGKPVEKPADPWAGVAPGVKEAFDKLGHRFSSYEGRLGSIDKRLGELAAGKAAATTVVNAPTQGQVDQAAKTPGRWDALKKEFPDWAEALEERIAKVPAPKEPDLNGFRTEVQTNVSQATAELRQLIRVDAKHPDWEATVKTPEFKAWFEKQAPDIQALAASADAKDAIQMLDAFEEGRRKAAEKPKNTERLKSAVTPTGVAAAQPAALNDNDAFDAGWKAVRGG